jgi:hypothetical protein
MDDDDDTLFDRYEGSYALLVRRNAAGSSTPLHGFVYLNVLIDMPDRPDYTCADSPSLDGTCLRPLSVSPLLHEMGGHAVTPAPTILTLSRFLARPQLLTRAHPLPQGRDISRAPAGLRLSRSTIVTDAGA